MDLCYIALGCVPREDENYFHVQVYHFLLNEVSKGFHRRMITSLDINICMFKCQICF